MKSKNIIFEMSFKHHHIRLLLFSFFNSSHVKIKFVKLTKLSNIIWKIYNEVPPPIYLAESSKISILEEVPILKKTIELYKIYYTFSILFHKKNKYTTGQTSEKYIIQTIELLLEASYASKETKRQIILTANNKFETLKIFIRIMKELEIIDEKKYILIQTRIQEIGKMFGGWMKSLPQ